MNDCVRLCLCVCAPMHVSVRVHEFALVCVLPGPSPVLVCLCQNAAPFRPFNRLSAWLPVLSTDWPVKALAVTMHYLTNPQATGFYCKYMLCHGLLPPPPPSLLLWAPLFFSLPLFLLSLFTLCLSSPSLTFLPLSPLFSPCFSSSPSSSSPPLYLTGPSLPSIFSLSFFCLHRLLSFCLPCFFFLSPPLCSFFFLHAHSSLRYMCATVHTVMPTLGL